MSKLALIQQDLEAAGESDRFALAANDIGKAVEESNNAFEAFYNDQAVKGEAGRNLLLEFITKLEEDSVAVQNAINHFQSFAETHGESAHHTREQIDEAKAELERRNAEIDQAVHDYTQYGVEAEQKLITIKFLKDIIEDELVSHSAGDTSFVQLKTFNDKMKELKGMLEKSHDSKFAPLVTTLLTLAEQRGFSDQNLLNQILNTLDKLANSIREFRHNQEKTGKKLIDDARDQAAHKHEEITTLSKNLEETLSQLRNAQTVGKKLQGEHALLDREIQRKKGELVFWDDIIAYQHQLHEKKKEERDDADELIAEHRSASLQ